MGRVIVILKSHIKVDKLKNASLFLSYKNLKCGDDLDGNWRVRLLSNGKLSVLSVSVFSRRRLRRIYKDIHG